MVWAGASYDNESAHALQWLQQGAALLRYSALLPLPSPLVFVDVETTRDRVVEVAVIRLQRGQWPTAWHTWVHPGVEAVHRSDRYWNTPIHGLNAPIAHNAPPFSSIATPLWGMCHDATMVAHNVSFEHRQLVLEYSRLGLAWSRPVLCTLKLARRLMPSQSSHALDELAPALHVRNPAPHRAMGDAITTVWCLLAMLERYGASPSMAEALRDARVL